MDARFSIRVQSERAYNSSTRKDFRYNLNNTCEFCLILRKVWILSSPTALFSCSTSIFRKMVLPKDVSTVVFRGHVYISKQNFDRKLSNIVSFNISSRSLPSLISLLSPSLSLNSRQPANEAKFTRVCGGKICFCGHLCQFVSFFHCFTVHFNILCHYSLER